MKNSAKILCALILVSGGGFVCAQTVYTNGDANGPFWSLAGNWSPGSVPDSSTSDVVISTQPTADFLVVDSGSKTVRDFTFSSSLTGSISVIGNAGEQLNIYGGISNLSSFSQSFGLVLNSSASASWTATNTINYTNIVNVGASSLTLTGAHVFSGSNLNFTITNASTYGRFLGAGTATVSGVIIGFSPSGYTGTAGDMFDFTTGAFTGATLNLSSLPTLSNGLVWNTSNFLTQGILTVSAVPEPATYAVLLGMAVLGFGAVRRRRKA